MRYGLILSSIHFGTSNYLWPALCNEVKRKGGSLFVFPCGKINALNDSDYLRNGINRLANHNNLEGLVIWGSSLTGPLGTDEVVEYCRTFSDVPYLTISCRTPDHPNIYFDSYSGFKSLVSHMIEVHGAKKIAFIPGPSSQSSSFARVSAYRDALREHGIEYDGNLVASPMLWTTGALSMKELLDERGLEPGVDFDTLVCASDLLNIDATDVLIRRGYNVPETVRTGSFNDNLESRSTKIAMTSVKLPYRKMAQSCIGKLSDWKNNSASTDEIIDTSLVVRLSCGCNGQEGFSSITDNASLSAWLRANFDPDAYSVSLYGKLIESSDTDEVRHWSKLIFEQLLLQGADIFRINSAIRLFSTLSIIPETVASFARSEAAFILSEVQGSVFASDMYASEVRMGRMYSLKNELLNVRLSESIMDVLHKHLVFLGISKCFIVLYNDELSSRLISYFSGDEIENPDELFPSFSILPRRFDAQLGSGIFVVEPLFTENRSMGYMVTETDVFSGTLLEDLRSSISNALSNTLMFEKMMEAKESAENEQRAKNSLLVNVGNVIRKPLSDVIGVLDGEDSLEGEVRKELVKSLLDVSYMVDLSLGGIDAMDTSYRLMPIKEFLVRSSKRLGIRLHSPSRLPLVRFDEEKLSEVIRIIKSFFDSEGVGVVIHTRLEESGVVVCIHGDDSNTEIHSNDAGLQLCRKILVIHGGDISVKDDKYYILLPYPSINGKKGKQGRKKAGAISKKTLLLCPWSKELVVPEKNGRIQWQKYSHIFFDVDNCTYDELCSLNTAFTDEGASGISLVLYSCGDAISMESLIKKKNDSFTKKKILLLGEASDEMNRWFPRQFIHPVAKPEDSARFNGDINLIISTNELTAADMKVLRLESRFPVPIVVMIDVVTEEYVEEIAGVPNVILAIKGLAPIGEFAEKVRDLSNRGSFLPPPTSLLVKKAEAFICSNYQRDVKRWEIARAVGLSEDYLAKIFKKELGMTPWEFLNCRRIEIATRLLKYSAASVSEIAEECGFSDQSYFARVFKRIRGCAPTQLRQWQ